jgi:maltose O-acetyltransferase
VTILTRNHAFVDTSRPMRDQGAGEISPVTISDDVWIGMRVIILPGVTIGRGAIIGAGAVVTKDVPPYCVAVGNPARVVRNRLEREVLSVAN